MLPENSRLIYQYSQISSALDALAETMNDRLVDSHPLVLCVMQGGLIFSGQLIPRLNCQLEIDYIHATRYQNNTMGAEICWKAEPVSSLKGRTILILDDILDKGITLQAVIQYCRAHGARQIFSAVLLRKIHAHIEQPVQADFVALEVEDNYVFGFGMDYQGQYRQLDGIYALQDEK